ncbi:hypothetical protein SAMN05216553_115136 [Lentzea fradiae]|uniref:Uncharacterized protein n=1 Tax=Lentzea fradiae TaxID=200378 RepID=A0A1G7ZEQ4_9PSEU|nr:hypothetical protein [Lentzea fradiae]SDH07047.1 hypothetical protein SAMN05216553_115136 [Lentzea fradiae]
MGITVIGITHPGHAGELPGGTNVLVLADDGTYAEQFLETDFRAHQLLVRAHGRGSAFFGVADLAREWGADRVLFGDLREGAPDVATGEGPVLVLASPGLIAFNASFGEHLAQWPRPASAYGDGLVTWLVRSSAAAGLPVVRGLADRTPLRTDGPGSLRKLTA